MNDFIINDYYNKFWKDRKNDSQLLLILFNLSIFVYNPITLIIPITENSLRIFGPIIGLLFLLSGFPIILSSKKIKNIET
jgi:hypothetical protein